MLEALLTSALAATVALGIVALIIGAIALLIYLSASNKFGWLFITVWVLLFLFLLSLTVIANTAGV